MSVVFLFAIFISSFTCDGCLPSSTQGCLNGRQFNFSTEFACKSLILNLSIHGCCKEAIPFKKLSQFCCYDGVHDDVSGTCQIWDPNAHNPDCYDCTYHPPPNPAVDKRNLMKQLQRKITRPHVDPINTLLPNTGKNCTKANANYGCLNTYPYVWSTEYPCFNWILQYAQHGCCDGTPFILSEDSCCYNEANSSYFVYNGDGHYCSCVKPNCDPN